eukprot:TRINITY_DN309_c4_g1_i3.p1 TRINITY_DN309_c4_g1~~TRINITY_DN309_c4_g1_i3.p1  ORF type:complete len:161 (-),score=68.36 TRINITY_DN309_c4_g1_i3:170-652(-)
MITPLFEVEQNDEYVIVKLRVPHLKASKIEFTIDIDTFFFHANPYFLRLVFPGELIENGKEKADYDVSAGIFIAHLPKKQQGLFFTNLDMTTKLLAKRSESVWQTPGIEEINLTKNKIDLESQFNNQNNIQIDSEIDNDNLLNQFEQEEQEEEEEEGISK